MADATIEIIKAIIPHPNADRLEIAQILGFECVTQKGLYDAGEKIVYIRPDAVLPLEQWTNDYRKYSPVRIKAAKLRGSWSEGIIVPFEILPLDVIEKLNKMKVGDDVSELLKVTHHVEPVPQNEDAKGGMPFNIPKTDEERVENLKEHRIPYGENVDISLKIDGQSSSYYYDIDSKRFGMLSRREEMKSRYDKNNWFHGLFIKFVLKYPYFKKFLKPRNNYDFVCEKYELKTKLIEFCEKNKVSLVIRGEIYGDGLQANSNNPHGVTSYGVVQPNDRYWAMYSVYLIKERRYAEKGDIYYYPNVASAMKLPAIPMVESNVPLTVEKIKHYSSDIKTLNNLPFEGVVVKTEKTSFKIINKHYDAEK
jgi:RNA ligase (TIGR02306 family)